MKHDLRDNGRGEALTITREVLEGVEDQGREGDSLVRKSLEIKDFREDEPLRGKELYKEMI